MEDSALAATLGVFEAIFAEELAAGLLDVLEVFAILVAVAAVWFAIALVVNF
jgi:hypothetical protein